MVRGYHLPTRALRAVEYLTTLFSLLLFWRAACSRLLLFWCWFAVTERTLWFLSVRSLIRSFFFVCVCVCFVSVCVTINARDLSFCRCFLWRREQTTDMSLYAPKKNKDVPFFFNSRIQVSESVFSRSNGSSVVALIRAPLWSDVVLLIVFDDALRNSHCLRLPVSPLQRKSTLAQKQHLSVFPQNKEKKCFHCVPSLKSQWTLRVKMHGSL